MRSVTVTRWSLPRLVGAVAAICLASCSPSPGGGDESTVGSTSPPAVARPSTTPAPGAPAPTATTVVPETTLAPGPRAIELCSHESSVVLGQVENPALDEASGLVTSRRHTGVIWSHNDGAEMPGLFAIAADGRDLGFHPLDIEGVDDVEDIALVDESTTGDGGDVDDILLADIGDNGADRQSIRVYRFAEPDPAVVGPISDVEVLEYVYPDRAHNAETLLVDQVNDRVVIVTKEQLLIDGLPAELGRPAPSLVFEGPLAGHGSGPVELTPAGVLDTEALQARAVVGAPNPITLLGLGGLPTGGDVSPDGALIALRTYETVWLWPRPTERTVAEALASDPCQARVAREDQGEAVAFFGGNLITLSEGVNQPLFELRP